MVRQERSERTRRNLIRAASTVFDQAGYERATLAAISDRAQVTKGALFFHFAAKSDLARAVQAEACVRSDAALVKLARRETPAFETATAMAHTLVGLLETDMTVRAGAHLAREIRTPDDPSLHCHLNWLDALYRILDRARNDGSLLPGVDVRAAAVLMLSMITGTTALPRLPVGPAGPGPSGPQPPLPPRHASGLRFPRENGDLWLTRMLHLTRPALSDLPAG
ncbi:ScbR family autoregulator-binding transcription factor [Streptomyces triticiradicis]|uniref:TetR/AcrR family transcriptional regulator n=1 Tax=Streptomyces triticiradicis TaxID=2651189 RepID=A0A7J5DIA6_9ACTN|nr:ScbR family autoregulator-binding transcription factor [Streptomyces triticiradicis]KAB1988375.1 TetR/AcrR family transcriptional regulator [Streptomyces triticiradicis]